MVSFQVIRQIGEARFSAVCLVRDKKSQKKAALKTIDLKGCTKKTRKEVECELEVLVQLKHPHLINCHKWFLDVSRNKACLLMDFYESGTLANQIVQFSELNQLVPEQLIMAWFVQICMAIDFLHSKNILHRNIKASNVFLVREYIAKVGDTGIARFLDPSGNPCGAFCAPECFAGKNYKASSDIWALGCLLYELCTLTKPSRAKKASCLYNRRAKTEEFTELPARYTFEACRLVRSMLSQCPDNRPTASMLLSLPYTRFHLNEFIAREERFKTGRVERKQMLQQEHCIMRLPSTRDLDCLSRISAQSSLPSPYSEELKSPLFEKFCDGFTDKNVLTPRRYGGRGILRQSRVSLDLLSPADVYQSDPALMRKSKPSRAYSAQTDTLPSPHGAGVPWSLDLGENLVTSPKIFDSSRPPSGQDDNDRTLVETSPEPRSASAVPQLEEPENLPFDSVDVGQASGTRVRDPQTPGLRTNISFSVSRVSSDPEDEEELPLDGSYDCYQSECDFDEVLETDASELELRRLEYMSRDDFDNSEDEMEWAEIVGRANIYLTSDRYKKAKVNFWKDKSNSYCAGDPYDMLFDMHPLGLGRPKPQRSKTSLSWHSETKSISA